MRINHLDIQVWDWPGEEPAVLLCHATGFHARCWDQVIVGLAERRVIALDLRGHGRSSKPPPPYAWRSFGKDVAGLASSLGLRGVLGVGHSVGGHAVTLAAALNPSAFSSLLLLDPVIFPENAYTGPRAEASLMAKRRNYWASPQEMFERFKSRPPFVSWDTQVLRDYCEYGLLPHDDGYVLACPPEVEASIYEHNSVPESNIYAEIAMIQIPVRVVRSEKRYEGGADMAASPTAPDLASRFRFGSDLRLERVSHLFPMEAPAAVSELIRESIFKRNTGREARATLR
jgi:pimeloyl-ACP methyl ester carboxylesterase